MHNTTSLNPHHVLGLLLACASAGAAQADNTRIEPPLGWSGSVTAGAMGTPDFEGSRGTRSAPVLAPVVSYRTREHGTFTLGQGLAWTFLARDDTSLSIVLTGDPGRTDTDARTGNILSPRPGSARLAGLGSIDSTAVVALIGSTGLGGLPVVVDVRKALGSHKGALATVGTSFPWKLSENASLSFSPSITWADAAYAQAYFGVSTAQAAASRFTRFDARAGLKSAQFAIGVDVTLTRDWHAVGAIDVGRLLGDAARSPIVERRYQARVMAGVQYRF